MNGKRGKSDDDSSAPNYGSESDESDARSRGREAGAKLVGDFLKKAASLGAGVYVTAEDAVSKTLNTVQVPPKMLREAIESFFEDYTVTINAEVKLKRKDAKKREG